MDKAVKLRNTLIDDIDKMSQRIREYSFISEKKKNKLSKLSTRKKYSNTDSSESFSM